MKIKCNKKLVYNIFLILSLFFIGFYSKAINLSHLINKELIGPDPYLFYRYTLSLLQKGKIEVPDMYRYFPLGTLLDAKPLIAFVGYFFIKILGHHGADVLKAFLNIIDIYPKSVYPDLIIQITPAILFGISTVIFYFIAREILKEDFKAFVSSLAFSFIPAISSRIMGGLYEKESIGLVFILLSIYLYIKYLKEENWKYILLSGVSSGFAAVSWGGWTFVPLLIGANELLRTYYYEKQDFRVFLYLVWIPIYTLLALSLKASFNIRWITYSLSVLVFFGVMLFRILILFLKKYNMELRYKNISISYKNLALIILALSSVIVLHQKILYYLSNPWLSRFALSVEEYQPTTLENWLESIGLPFIFLLYLYYVFLFYNKSKNVFEKVLSIIYPGIFLISILVVPKNLIFINWILFGIFVLLHYIFVKENTLEFLLSTIPVIVSNYMVRLLFYSGIFIPIFSLKSLDIFDKKLNLDKKYIYLFSSFLPFISLSFIFNKVENSFYFLLVPTGPLISSFINFKSLFISFILPSLILFIYLYSKSKSKIGFIVFSFLLFGIPFIKPGLAFNLYSYEYFTSGSYGKAWVQIGNAINSITEENSIFAHWWDYGYYVQTLGNRSTILDGGNQIVYWNHLMGRYVLCGNKTSALEFLYSHTKGKPTYLLIDPTDLGKFYQFSRLGSDLNFDKLSNLGSYILYITSGNIIEFRSSSPLGSMFLDENLEVGNRIIRRCVPDFGITYPRCGIITKVRIYARKKMDNMLYDINLNKFVNLSRIVRYGGEIYIPKSAIVEGYGKEVTEAYKNITDAEIVILYDGKEYIKKLKCIYLNGKRIYYNEKGFGCLYLVKCKPGYEELCGFLISNKALNYLWIKLYFFNKYSDNFKLVFSTGDIYMMSPPWKIWKVEFPEGFKVDEKKECLFLARNLEEINKCVEKYGGKRYNSIWEV